MKKAGHNGPAGWGGIASLLICDYEKALPIVSIGRRYHVRNKGKVIVVSLCLCYTYLKRENFGVKIESFVYENMKPEKLAGIVVFC